ncbi:antibiotic biosynthesis monooxygenase family protein [Melghirimyces algeriensis]|uniref:Heme-degrading monooxygenase HmoA n=1 Tax=Melghirimyces algeriensis TaxID=910412 RepID=A0A521EZY5_9BACL|nr:antibiotic biosynthesis monooxygenase family protein [Melghirimyces algeriensis]SMO88740.1 Heme-degrading monooxygenase HmoA [Melghirimyces algeriensis]
MYQVNNQIQVDSKEHMLILVERFRQAPERMKEVPGFVSFRLLQAEDGTHLVAETVFRSKEDFIRWTESEHFAQSHGGRKRSDRTQTRNSEIKGFEVLIT